jgi:hypothetical protein
LRSPRSFQHLSDGEKIMRRIAVSLFVLCAGLFGAGQSRQAEAGIRTLTGVGCGAPGLNVSIGFCGSGGGGSLTWTVPSSNSATFTGTAANFSGSANIGTASGSINSEIG